MAQWQQTNGPTGGSVHDIVSTPGHVFVNSGLGGIFRSSDNGLSWSVANNGLPENPQCVTLISNGSTLYAGISSSGVYKSDDNGLTWIPINEGVDDRTFRALLVDSQDIYAGTDGFFYSPDNGATWIQRESFQGSGYISSFAKSGNKIFASVTGATAGVYISEDKGISWTKLNLPPTQISKLTSFDNAIYAPDVDFLYISRDFGETWSTSVPVMAAYAVDDKLYVARWDSKIYYSEDEGTNFSPLTTILPEDEIVYGIHLTGNTLFVGGVAGIVASSDNGVTWVKRHEGLRNCGIGLLAASDPYVYAGALVSEDNGATWSTEPGELRDANSNVLDWAPTVGIHVAEDDVVLGLKNGLFTSSDHGQTWNLKQQVPEESLSSVVGQGDLVMAASETKQYYSANGGESWVIKTNSIFNGAYPGQGIIRGDTIVLLGLYTLNKHVYISKDFGDSWESFTIPNVFTATQVVYVNKKLFVSSWSGVFVSPDFGVTWTSINEGLPSDEVTTLAARNGNLYVGTTKGVFVSYDEGDHWLSMNEGLWAFSPGPLVFSSTHLFSGSRGNSVWSIPLDRLSIVPICTGVVSGLQVTAGLPLTITLDDLVVDDPDSNFPEDFTLFVLPGPNYTVVGNTVTPAAGFNGDLQVSIMVNDGYNNSSAFVATIGIVVGVEEDLKKSHAIYPNPATDKIALDVSHHGDITSFSIKDCLGRTILENTISTQSEINVSQLSPGVYYLVAYPQNKVFRFVKKE